MGTFPAFLSAWGPVDFSFGSGQGVKCVHSEHLYGEFWHRGFTVCADTPFSRYIVSFGANVEVIGRRVRGAPPCRSARARRQARADRAASFGHRGRFRANGCRSSQRPTPHFMFAMFHVLLHEQPRAAPRRRLSCAIARPRPIWSAPWGYYLRDSPSVKPLVWDSARDVGRPIRHGRRRPDRWRAGSRLKTASR